METIIKPDLRKPFRGVTTIQLFDKDTGEEVKKVVSENTYNDRIQFLNYINTILTCKPPSIARNESFQYTQEDTHSSGRFSTFWTNGETTYEGSSGYDTYGCLQFFANMMMTADTEPEGAHGYFSGMPVGICSAAYASSGLLAMEQCGTINTTESYISDDRLHLVFDFDTSSGNITFDALWLLPASTRRSSYYLSPPMKSQGILIYNETTEMSLPNTTLMTVTQINWPYIYITYKQSGSNYSYRADTIEIRNALTGEHVKTYSYDAIKNIGVPVYYDEATDKSYAIFTYDGSLTNSAYWGIITYDLTTGTQLSHVSLYEALGLADFMDALNAKSYTGSARGATLLLEDGSLYLSMCVRVVDKDTAENTDWFIHYSFDHTDGTFTRLAYYRIYNWPALNTEGVLYNEHFFTTAVTKPTGSRWTCFDVRTGDIISKDIINISTTALYGNPYYNDYGYPSYSKYGTTYHKLDQKVFRQPYYWFERGKKHKYFYRTANWSTHNKLPSKVTKTDMTTMKIQYDIIWDNIKDVVVPALL